MTTTTLSVGSIETIGATTDLTISGTYNIDVVAFGGSLNVAPTVQTALVADIITITGSAPGFTDFVSGNAVEIFNPVSLDSIVPFFTIGGSPGMSPEPGNGTLELGNNLSDAQVNPLIFFNGTNNDLVLGNSLSTALLGPIYGFTAASTTETDTIDLQGVTNVASVTWTQNAGTTGGILTLDSASNVDLSELTLATGTFSTSQFSITTDSVGGTEITVACFHAGTRIATPAGEVAVETLAIGDRVITADGSHKPVKWLGRRTYSGRFAAGKTHLLPIRFTPGALGNGRPRRDLWVSPQHAMLIDGALIPAACLVNGASIIQETRVERIEYVHVELERHDVIFAEGAASETYINDDNRLMFHNASSYAARYDDDAISRDYCAERIVAGPVLAAIRTRLAGLAGISRTEGTPGGLIGRFERIETDKAGTWAVGWAQNQSFPDMPVCFEILRHGRLIHRGLANRHRPDVEDAGFGSGQHGFRVAVPHGAMMADLVVRRAADQTVLPCATETQTTQTRAA
ncbi:MAG: Hint domain-containing protein [Acidiphilium sp.]|nr:Hint domain-containing protein [Acidiphilium sp.]MDD4936365.1 Hint domain-containing protein [Acidiphilium sp.]